MRAIKDQHRQRASLVSTDGAKVWDSFVPDEFLRVGGKLEKVLGKEVHFFTPFWALWRKFGESLEKVRESLVKVLVKTFVRIRREGGGLLKRIR